MYILIICISILHLVSTETINNYGLKYSPVRPKTEPLYPKDKHQEAIGATYQSITKRQLSGAPSSSTTAEIQNTVTSPHSSSSVSFTKTSIDHTPDLREPAHPEYRREAVEPPLHNYELQNYIVNEPEHVLSEKQIPYTYRFAPNYTYPPNLPRVSPKAFSYQPVITLANNIKSFYKVNQYTPFVVPDNVYQDPRPDPLLYPSYPRPEKLVYPNYPAIPDNAYYKHYSPSNEYPASYNPLPAFPQPVKIFPTNVVSYNVSAYPAYEAPSVTPAPVALPPPNGLELVHGVPKPYKDNAYIEPDRSVFYRPVLFGKKYLS